MERAVTTRGLQFIHKDRNINDLTQDQDVPPQLLVYLNFGTAIAVGFTHCFSDFTEHLHEPSRRPAGSTLMIDQIHTLHGSK